MKNKNKIHILFGIMWTTGLIIAIVGATKDNNSILFLGCAIGFLGMLVGIILQVLRLSSEKVEDAK